ncbi:hypothetical protein [Streptomyces sp. NPDC052107]|uniref:hypothetical protein n=1 Tax=Streptomyces sp. NPDC052107 TaxID=3155632 RepID=UPI00342C449A
MEDNEIDLATVRALFPTSETNAEGDLGTDGVLDEWLQQGYDIALYRATDHRLLVRPTNSAGHTPGWLIGPRYGKAQLESLYINPHPIEAAETATACPPDGHTDENSGEATPATESHPGPELHIADPFDFQGAANAYISQVDDGEYEIELIDEGGLPGCSTYMETLSFRLLPAAAPSSAPTEQDARVIEAATAELADHGYAPTSAWTGSTDSFRVKVGITDWGMDRLWELLYATDPPTDEGDEDDEAETEEAEEG